MSVTTDDLFGGNGVRSMLSVPTFKRMAAVLGLTAGAIAVTAGHQIAAEEGRRLLERLRSSRTMRRDRNNAVLCALIAEKSVPFDVIKYLEEQRDVFRATIRLSVDDNTPEEARVALRQALRDLYTASHSRAG